MPSASHTITTVAPTYAPPCTTSTDSSQARSSSSPSACLPACLALLPPLVALVLPSARRTHIEAGDAPPHEPQATDTLQTKQQQPRTHGDVSRHGRQRARQGPQKENWVPACLPPTHMQDEAEPCDGDLEGPPGVDAREQAEGVLLVAATNTTTETRQQAMPISFSDRCTLHREGPSLLDTAVPTANAYRSSNMLSRTTAKCPTTDRPTRAAGSTALTR